MSETTRVVVSGIRATGRMHLGNYIGAMRNFSALQEEYRCFFFVADYHTLTSLDQPDKLRQNLPEIVMDYLAAGLDPEKSVIFAQSSVPEIAELSLLLSMVTMVGELQRCPTFKDKVKSQPDNINLGLFSYPTLMAADILIQRANLVPVGEDQLPHIELARVIAGRFNQKYGKVFPLPGALLEKAVRVPGLDGSGKMGKSDSNTIDLADTSEMIHRKFASAVTDTARQRRTDPGNPYNCRLFDIHEFVSDAGIVEQIKTDCQHAKIGCVDCKRILANSTIDFLAPFQTRRAEITPSFALDVLHTGGQTARQTASQTLTQARELMGLREF